ncbi:MAG: tetratricopeptide repeat protein [bacterium]
MKRVSSVRCRVSARILLVPWVAFVLSGCSTPVPRPDSRPDAELVQLSKSAVQAFDIGAFDRAARFYELALERARRIDDGIEVAKNASNLAACKIKAGKLEEAEPLLAEAKAEFTKWRKDSTGVTLLQAQIAKERGDMAGTAALLKDVLLWGGAKTESRLQAYIMMADMACDAGNRDEATVALRKVNTLAGSVSEPALRGGAARVSGRVALLKGNTAQAAAEFDREIAFLQKAHRYREMAAALDRAGAAWLESGGEQQAADRYYRAARSTYAQGDIVAALKSIDRAMDAAQKAGDENLAAGISALMGEISAAVKSAASQEDAPAP